MTTTSFPEDGKDQTPDHETETDDGQSGSDWAHVRLFAGASGQGHQEGEKEGNGAFHASPPVQAAHSEKNSQATHCIPRAGT